MAGILEQFRSDPVEPPATAPEEVAAPTGILDQFVGDPLDSAPTPPANQFTAGIGTGVDNVQTTSFGIAQLVGRELGLKTVQDFGAAGVERNQIEASENGIRVHGFSDVENMDDFFDWATSSIGTQIPQLGGLIVSGGVGGAMAKAAVNQSIKKTIRNRMMRNLTVRGMTPEQAALAADKALTSPAGFKMLRDGITRGTPNEQLAQQAFTKGAKGGVFAFSATQQAAETDIALTDAGIDAGFTSIVAGALGGALETLPALRIIDRAFPGVDQILAKGFIKDFAVNMGIQGGLEGSTEAAQEVIQMAAMAYHDPSFDMLDPDNLTRLTDSFAAGALLGVVMGGGADAISATPGAVVDAVDKVREIRERFRMPEVTVDTESVADPESVEDFVPADNTFYEEVKGRINRVVKETLEPALNTLTTQVQEGIDRVAAAAPALNDAIGDLAGSASEAQEEFLAGHQPIIDDTIRYAKEQAAYIASQAEGMVGEQRAKYVREKIAAVKEELKRVAATLQKRADKVVGSVQAGIGARQSLLREAEDRSAAETSFVFGQVERRLTKDGLPFQHITRAEEAEPLFKREDARKLIARLRKRYPSASDSTFAIREQDDGTFLVELAEGEFGAAQVEALREDEAIADGLEAARLSQRGNRDKEDKRTRVKVQIKGRKGRTILDVKTLAEAGKRLDAGDNQTLAEGLTAMLGRLLDRGTLSEKDVGAILDAFERDFSDGEQQRPGGQKTRGDRLQFESLPRKIKAAVMEAINARLLAEGLEAGTKDYAIRFAELRKAALDNIDAQLARPRGQVAEQTTLPPLFGGPLVGEEAAAGSPRDIDAIDDPAPRINMGALIQSIDEEGNRVVARESTDTDPDSEALSLKQRSSIPTEEQEAGRNPQPSAARPRGKDAFDLANLPARARAAIKKWVQEQLKAEGLSAGVQKDLTEDLTSLDEMYDTEYRRSLSVERAYETLDSLAENDVEGRAQVQKQIDGFEAELEADAAAIARMKARDAAAGETSAAARDKFFERFYELRREAIDRVQEQRDNPTPARRKAASKKKKAKVKKRVPPLKKKPKQVSREKRLARLEAKRVAKTATPQEKAEARVLRNILGKKPRKVMGQGARPGPGKFSINMDTDVSAASKKAIGELVARVLKMVNSKTEVIVIDMETAEDMMFDPDHPHQDIGAAFVQGGSEFAIVHSFDGSHPTYILMGNPSEHPDGGVSGLIHELGHLLHFDTWGELDASQQDALWDAFVADVRSGKRKTGAKINDANSQHDTIEDADINMFEFREWMADQFVDWVANRRQPKTAIEKFLQKVMVKMEKLWEFIALNPGRYGMLNATFADFADSVAKNLREKDPTGRHQFFRNEGAAGRPANILEDGEAGDIGIYQPEGVTQKEWQELAKRLTEQYPVIAARAKLMSDWMNAAYHLYLAPSTSVMRSIGERIKAANELVTMFNRELHGKAKKVQNYHLRVKQMKGSFTNKYNAITKDMTEAEKASLLKRLREMDSDPKATPKTAQERAIRKLFDTMHAYLTVEAGLPVGNIPNYFPRSWSREQLIKNEEKIIKHLMSKGMKRDNARSFYNSLISFESSEAAVLRNMQQDEISMKSASFRNMRSRTMTDPFFDQFLEDNLDGAVATYIVAAVKKAEYNRFLGSEAPKGTTADTLSIKEWNPRGNIDRILQDASDQGATEQDLKKMRDYVEAQLGQLGRDDVSDKVRTLMASVVAFQNLRLLLFTVFASLPDVVGPAIRAGDMGLAFRTAVKNYKKIIHTENDLDEMARAFGAISTAANQSILTEYVDNHYMPPTLRKWNDAYFKWTGLNYFTDTTRRFALAVGIDSIKDQAKKVTHGKTAKIRNRAKQFLGELGLTADMVDVWVDEGERVWGGVGVDTESDNDQRIAEALLQFVDESIMSPNPSTRPIMASHPGAMLIYHLKGFIYQFHEVVLKRLAHNFDIADTPAQVAAAIAPAILIMAITAFGLELRELVTQRKYTNRMDGWEYTWTVMERSGLLGISQLGFDFQGAGARGQSSFAALGGPTISQLGDLISKPLSQTIPKGIPIVSQLPWARDALREYTPL